jgi:hypothetical protein
VNLLLVHVTRASEAKQRRAEQSRAKAKATASKQAGGESDKVQKDEKSCRGYLCLDLLPNLEKLQSKQDP